MEVSCYPYEQWLSEKLGVSFLQEGNKWNTEDDVEEVVRRINECPNLKFLELEGNTLGVSASKAIGKALENKRELEAALWKDLFTGRLKNEIPQAFNFLFAGVDLAGASLQRLDLSDNAIGPVGMVGLGPFFRTRSSFSLKELILNNNGFGPEGGSSLAEALMDCLRLSKESGGPIFQLKVFVCGRNRLESKAAKRLAQFFKEVETLEEVHMPQNGIYKDGIGALSEGLRCNKNMRILNLNDNTIRGEGIVKLADAISELKNLKELSLTDCLLKGSGMMKIVNALKSCVNISKINFSGNEIPKSSAKQAAESLRSLSSLEEVNFSSNSLGTEGGEFVSNILDNVNVIIEDDEGTELEDEESGEEEEGEISNVYEDISSSEEQANTSVDTKLKKTAVETFINSPSETNFTLLDKDSPYEVLRQYISDAANKENTVGRRSVDISLRILGSLEIDRATSKVVPERFVSVFLDLLSDGLRDESWTPNEFTTYLLVSLGVFKAEPGAAPPTKRLNDLTLYLLSKWLTERGVPRNVAFYLAVISRNFLKERSQQFGIKESSVVNFQKVTEAAYNHSLKMGSATTIPVSGV